LVENREIVIPHRYFAPPPRRVITSEFREDVDISKVRMIWLSCGEETMTNC